jgi:phosphoglycolate phosphatase
MKRNNLAQPIYVGDTQGDCDAAKLANIPFVFASYRFGKVDGYDYVIQQVEDIVRLFQCND